MSGYRIPRRKPESVPATSATIDLTGDETPTGLLIAKTDATNGDGHKGVCLALLNLSSGQLMRPIAREGLVTPFWSYDAVAGLAIGSRVRFWHVETYSNGIDIPHSHDDVECELTHAGPGPLHMYEALLPHVRELSDVWPTSAFASSGGRTTGIKAAERVPSLVLVRGNVTHFKHDKLERTPATLLVSDQTLTVKVTDPRLRDQLLKHFAAAHREWEATPHFGRPAEPPPWEGILVLGLARLKPGAPRTHEMLLVGGFPWSASAAAFHARQEASGAWGAGGEASGGRFSSGRGSPSRPQTPIATTTGAAATGVAAASTAAPRQTADYDTDFSEGEEVTGGSAPQLVPAAARRKAAAAAATQAMGNGKAAQQARTSGATASRVAAPAREERAQQHRGKAPSRASRTMVVESESEEEEELQDVQPAPAAESYAEEEEDEEEDEDEDEDGDGDEDVEDVEDEMQLDSLDDEVLSEIERENRKRKHDAQAGANTRVHRGTEDGSELRNQAVQPSGAPDKLKAKVGKLASKVIVFKWGL